MWGAYSSLCSPRGESGIPKLPLSQPRTPRNAVVSIGWVRLGIDRGRGACVCVCGQAGWLLLHPESICKSDSSIRVEVVTATAAALSLQAVSVALAARTHGVRGREDAGLGLGAISDLGQSIDDATDKAKENG